MSICRFVIVVLLLVQWHWCRSQQFENEIKRPIRTKTQYQTKIFKDCELRTLLGTVQSGDSIEIIGWGYWVIRVSTPIGTGYSRWGGLEARNQKRLDSLMRKMNAVCSEIERNEVEKEKRREREKSEADREKRIAERNREIDLKFGRATAHKIKSHDYWIGMTDEMAEYSLGRPTKINRTVTSLSVLEQWVYEGKDLYLYFENGKLTSFQDSR